MSKRNCTYTGEEAKVSDNVVPKAKAGEEIHNWTNKVPCSEDYKELKQGRLPTELEMEAHGHFVLMELYRNKAKWHEEKLKEIQETLKLDLEDYKLSRKQKQTKKDRQIEQAYIEKEVTEPKKYEEILDKRKDSLWD